MLGELRQSFSRYGWGKTRCERGSYSRYHCDRWRQCCTQQEKITCLAWFVVHPFSLPAPHSTSLHYTLHQRHTETGKVPFKRHSHHRVRSYLTFQLTTTSLASSLGPSLRGAPTGAAPLIAGGNLAGSNRPARRTGGACRQPMAGKGEESALAQSRAAAEVQNY